MNRHPYTELFTAAVLVLLTLGILNDHGDSTQAAFGWVAWLESAALA